MGEVKPGDESSGLVERSWVRRSRKQGQLTERTLEGEQVSARFLDDDGSLRQIAGTVRRKASGMLVVESIEGGITEQTAVPREASVDRRTPGEARLIIPAADKQRDVLRRWQRTESGMDGPRGLMPETPEEPVAYKLLDAAGDAISQGELRQALAILHLVVKEYRHSQEAACARSVIDRLAARGNSRS